MAVATRDNVFVGPTVYERSRIPSPVPTMLQVDPAIREQGDVMQVNFGPNHPSTHGVLRLVIDLNGERVVGLNAKIGWARRSACPPRGR